MTRRWHLMHRDGREWTKDELEEVIRVDREHDGLWPYDATLIAITIDDWGSDVYILDNCMTWHMASCFTDGVAEDMVVVDGDLRPLGGSR